jgi:hypothetical protein
MKISELTQVAEISRDIKLPLSVDGKNFNVTVGQILDAAQAQLPDATGKAGGLATLDDNSLIPTANIPATALSDVIEFGGTVAGVDAETRGGTMTAEGSDGTTIVVPTLAILPSEPTTLLYDTENKRLVVREIDSFTVGGKVDLETGTTSEPTPVYKYTYWAANGTEDTSNVAQYYRTKMRPGGVPYVGKVYINTATGQLYRWNGSDLVEVGSVVKIGTTEGTAFDGAEGNNLRTEVTSLTSRVAGIAIVPFDGFWSGDTAHRPAGGVRYNLKNDKFLIVSLPDGYSKEDYLDTSDADNVVIRQDVIFRHDNALYSFNGTTLVAVGGGVGNCYNLTSEVPLTEGLYYSMDGDADYYAPRVAYDNGKTIPGLQMTFAVANGIWKTYQYVGMGITEEEFTNAENWLDLASTVTETTAAAKEATANAIIATEAAEKATSDVNEILALYASPETLWAYGVEFSTAISSPTCTRIGRTELHKKCPIQSQMKGCLLDDDGNVVEYLDTTDWTSATRDGSCGQVMVELPEHYRKFETDGNIRRVWLSEYALPGYHHVPKRYVSAYQATVQHSTSKLASVVNTDADYRGGNNDSSYDDSSNTLLGRPATYISRTAFRAYARNRKSGSTEWNCMTYDIQKELYWLFVVEYATLNSQADYNAALTSEGYRQGGLGSGVSTLDVSKWNKYNSMYPIIPCGYTDILGNNTGVVAFQMPEEYGDTVQIYVPRYRGVENPFGHIWQWTDGINIRISPTEENGGDGLSKVFICEDPAMFADSDYTGYSYIGNEARDSGYIQEIVFGEGGEIVPSSVGGGSSTYFCDRHATTIETSEVLRAARFGGYAADGASCGFAYLSSTSSPLTKGGNIGSRLCFIPE